MKYNKLFILPADAGQVNKKKKKAFFI